MNTSINFASKADLESTNVEHETTRETLALVEVEEEVFNKNGHTTMQCFYCYDKSYRGSKHYGKNNKQKIIVIA